MRGGDNYCKTCPIKFDGCQKGCELLAIRLKRKKEFRRECKQKKVAVGNENT